MIDPDDINLRLLALSTVVGVIVIGVGLLLADVVWNFLDDDVAAAVAGFLGGIIGMLTWSLAQWIARWPPKNSD